MIIANQSIMINTNYINIENHQNRTKEINRHIKIITNRKEKDQGQKIERREARDPEAEVILAERKYIRIKNKTVNLKFLYV